MISMTLWKRPSRLKLGVTVAAIIGICIAASGFGSVSYYFLRNKVVAHLHLCAPDDNIRLAWFSWWPRATALGMYLANPGGTVHIPPNYTETLSSTLTVQGNQVLMFDGPATLTLTGSAQIVVIPPGSVIGYASALVRINCAQVVDCMTYRTSPFSQVQAGTLKGFRLEGNKTAASGLHYGDVMGMRLEDVVIANFLAGTGLWGDNITGFTERYILERVSLDNNLVGWKLTNSSPGCDPHYTSFSYGRAISVTMRLHSGQTGMEVGPAAMPAHFDWWMVMNGQDHNGKTFLKIDAAAGVCVLPARVNNGRLTLVGEDDGTGSTFVDIGQGASLAGECFLHAYDPGGSPVMTNNINGTLACQTYLGPTGNQIIFDQRSWPSSDVILHFPTITTQDTLATLGAKQVFTGSNIFSGATDFYNELYSLDGHSLTFYSDNFVTPTIEISGTGSVYGKNFGIVGGSAGWSGTCPSGHSLLVSGGIVIGCN
jgi:hypothetical protein